MKKIYVDRLSETCEECGFLVKTYQSIPCNALRALYQNEITSDHSIILEYRRHSNCPLISAHTYVTEETISYEND